MESCAPWYDQQVALLTTAGALTQRNALQSRRSVLVQRIVQRHLDHFHALAAQRIHVFGTDMDTSLVEELTHASARMLHYHIAILSGETIADERSLLLQIGEAYGFPDHPSAAPNWNGTLDWWRDLSWITGRPDAPTSVKGFLLFYRSPAGLFTAEPVRFALALDAISSAAYEHSAQELPFHVVVGPLQGAINVFINLLKVADRFCASCWDGRSY